MSADRSSEALSAEETPDIAALVDAAAQDSDIPLAAFAAVADILALFCETDSAVITVEIGTP